MKRPGMLPYPVSGANYDKCTMYVNICEQPIWGVYRWIHVFFSSTMCILNMKDIILLVKCNYC